jgi:hypothetical protein
MLLNRSSHWVDCVSMCEGAFIHLYGRNSSTLCTRRVRGRVKYSWEQMGKGPKGSHRTPWRLTGLRNCVASVPKFFPQIPNYILSAVCEVGSWQGCTSAFFLLFEMDSFAHPLVPSFENLPSPRILLRWFPPCSCPDGHMWKSALWWECLNSGVWRSGGGCVSVLH